MGRLANKNILITGGNSGIGLAAAQEFEREGARVAICGLNEGSLQAAKETLGPGSLAVHADVSNLTDLDTMFATIKRKFGHLDGVFVNAGYSVFLPFEKMTEQNFDKVIAVKDVLRTNNPSKRLADPLEIAKLAVYLASDDSAYVVGADFLIDGGVTAISGVGA